MSPSETDTSTARRFAAWLFSVLAHAAILVAVVWSFRGTVHEPELEPDRLVFVEPAPPPPPPPAPVAADSAPQQPVEPVPEPQRLVDAPTKPKPAATRKPTPRPTAAAPAAPAPEVAKPAAVEGVAGGVEGGTVGGTVGGKIGGVVGGHGDQVVAANVAAVAPVVLSRILPEYPPQARAQRREGQVLLQAIVDRQGHVEDDVVVLRSEPPFDEAAIRALRQWRFTPGKDGNGRPVRVQIEVPMRFQLK